MATELTSESTCKVCGKPVPRSASDKAVNRSPRKSFCSEECRHAGRRVRKDKHPRSVLKCQWCGTDFTKSRSHSSEQKYCSKQCRIMGGAENKRTDRIRQICKCCGKSFEAVPWFVSAGRATFCSRECFYKGRETRKKRQFTFVCQFCGKVFCSSTPKRKYCSRQCSYSAQFKLDKEPKKSRPTGHANWSRKVILRDKKCIRCGSLGNLQAHHVRSWKGNPELRYDVGNGATLCPWCHHSQHPYMPLEQFIRLGGKNVRYCLVCESPFIGWPTKQQTCGRRCGQLLRRRKSREK